jgi:flagellar FliJ protein
MTTALQTLLEHAERQRDTARAALLQSEQATLRLQQQAEQLQAYLAEYELRDPTRGGRSAPIELLRCHIGFVQRLQQAQAQQRGQLQAAEARAARQRQALLVLETRVASVRKLLERRDHDQRRAADRVEQRHSDEAAMQRAWRDRAEAQAQAVN